MKSKRIFSLILSLAVILGMTQIPVIADTEAMVYFTVSNKGILAADRDENAAANLEVTVKDLNGDGKLTYDEALVAAHDEYNSKDGYSAQINPGYTSVTKLWGVDTYNTLFFINNEGINNVAVDTVSQGDRLTASVNKDDEYYADWYTFFDSDFITVRAGEEFELTLKGHLGMAYTDEEKADIALPDVEIGTWENGSFAALDGKKTDADGKAALSFDSPGTYYVTASGTVESEVFDWATEQTVTHDCPIIAPVCVVTVENAQEAPETITISHDAKNVLDGKIVCRKGDKFKLTAYDQNGDETPVTWKNESYGNTFTLDEATGEVEVTGDIYSSTSYLYFTAISTIDESVSGKITIQATGFVFGEYQKTQTVALSEDGQSAKTASVTGGINGCNIWSYNIPDGVASLAADPGAGSSIKFNVFRPGTITAAFKLAIDEELTDTAQITVTGVAVEDTDGNNTKTYLGINTANPNPTKQLVAFAAEGRTIETWGSADETVATVDENGLVSAKGIGSTIITAIDSEGVKGGIKVVVESEEIPYFEALEFATTAFNTGVWVKDTTFVPTKLEYDLPIKNYSTSSLALQATTLYDTDKYTATAEYIDVNGKRQSVAVNSGKITTLANQPFDASVMTITISDKNNAQNKTVYTFNVSRPRDTTKAVKSSGITLAPAGRVLSATTYNGVAEGAMQKADETGAITSGTGVSGTQYYYRTFVYDDVKDFQLNLASSTAYSHIRYSTDGGATWVEIPQGGGVTGKIAVPESDATEVLVQIIDDAAYADNIKAGKDGFDETEPTQYKVWINKVAIASPQILTAEVSGGDWYPAFCPDMYSYWLVVENGGVAPVLTYTVKDGDTVKIGTAQQTADENGKYTVTLGTAQTSISVTSADGNFTNVYKFGYRKKSALDVPDKVVDYLCIGSQYTNAAYGVNPETTLSGSLKSLGNFGGYITYYYEEPIVDSPNNKYGMDFYVIGNSSETNIDSMAELGQVYVSEDGESWYALAGSEHYEDNAIWDYTITYTKGEDGKAYWTDNCGNSIDYVAKAWPSGAYYYMNDVCGRDSYTFSGILFKSQLGTVTGDNSSTASYAAKARFGYADYYASNVSGTTLNDVNSYVENPSKANGFDLAWAVDENGVPVDVSDKKFHYVKVATASNIYAGGFAEKSTEVTYVVRTTPQEEEVGKTAAPAGVTISDGADSKNVNFTEGQNVYAVNLDNMKYVSIKVNGAGEDDNIYINNQRVSAKIAAEGFKVTKEKGETLVRVIVQNGDKEPCIYLLKLISSAEESDELIEGIKINAGGTVREASTKNGVDYTASVGYRIDSIAIAPVADGNVILTVNGEAPAELYDLSCGSNVFEIAAVGADGKTQTITLTVTRESAPSSGSSTITVKFALYGDEKHGSDETHTYKNDKSKLPVWIAQKAYTVNSGATVLDVFEKALKEAGLTWKNDGGNYICEIDGLKEFDNGSLSGWMYLLNSTYPGLGVAEQTLKNGDIIIFHYTDDHTMEQSSQQWNSGSLGGAAASYTVKFETNGAGTVSSQNINPNGTVKKPADPTKEGYTFEGWYTDKELSKAYDFSAKVESSFTLYAKWTENIPVSNDKVLTAFKDVKKGAWYEQAVAYTVEKKLFEGVSETEFAPDEGMTRAMLVTVLYRIENPEKQESTISFSDVYEGEWYTDAVIWANQRGIVNGVSETEFAPNAKITREQMAAVLYRYAQYKGQDTSSAENTNILSYEDADEISEYAVLPMQWAVGCKIIEGSSNVSLNPKGNATRAQTAAMLMRYCEMNVE
ncbi:MAG: S-layer homology domain-containing protein [Clostridiales bacterium]|nr:S-layer homology domain-containing protein [Clostridiales bacterium]